MRITEIKKKMENVFVAITFAEAQLPSWAREILHPQSFAEVSRQPGLGRFLKDVGLHNTRIRYCIVKV